MPLPTSVLRCLLRLGVPGLALAACAVETGPTQAPPPAIDGQRALDLVRRQVELGPRPSGSESAARLRALLAAELSALGLEVRSEAFQSETPAGPVDFVNLWVELPGRPHARDPGADDPGARDPGAGDPGGAPIVYLVAHMDTKRMPFEFVGANDGASASALLVELARALAAQRDERAVTYRLLWVDGEEAVRPEWAGVDNLYGSRHHVQQLEASGELGRVAACVVLDMIGDRELGLLREGYSDPRLRRIFEDAARDSGHADAFHGPLFQLRDDHLSFQTSGVPSIVLIDFSYGPGNAWWHTADDTLDKLSAQSLQTVGEIVLAGLPELEAWVLE